MIATPKVLRHENVRRLEILMDDPGIVQGGHAAAHLVEDADRLVDREHPALVLHEPVVQVVALDVLHRDVGRALVLAHVEHLHDVHVPHAGHRSRLGNETRATVVGEPAVATDQLERDVSVQHLITGVQHDAHAARAELGEDAVPIVDERELLGDRKRRRGAFGPRAPPAPSRCVLVDHSR